MEQANQGTAFRLSNFPRAAVVVALSAATLGIIYGYDQSNIGGAQLFFEADLDLDTQQVELVTTMVVYGELIGAVMGGLIINRLGRKTSILGVAVGYALFCALSAVSVSAQMLGITRFFLGLTIGISLIAVPVFVAESVPARVRGATLVMYQVATVIGIILGYLFSFGLSSVDQSINWRLMLGIAAVPALVLIPVLMRLPETSRWLMMKGRVDDARASILVTDPDADVEAEVAAIEHTLRKESGGAIREMLRKPFLRATVFVVLLGFFIQITGINATVTYGPKIFQAMGATSNAQSIGLALLVQVIALIAVLVSMTKIDNWGRRPVLLSGIAIMIVAQLIMVAVFATQQGDEFSTLQVVFGFIGLALINVGFVFGFGSLVWVYSTESFPDRLRSYGSSAMLGSDLIANIIIAQFFLTVMATIGGAWSFGIFAILAAIAWLFVLKFAPETKGRDLDDIQVFWENGGTWPADEKRP